MRPSGRTPPIPSRSALGPRRGAGAVAGRRARGLSRHRYRVKPRIRLANRASSRQTLTMRSNISTSGQSSSQAKRTFTEEARRAQILTHAIDVVVEHGYAGASLNRIAAHAGISKGLISYHFDGKADLLEALVRDVFARGAEIAMRERPGELNEDAPAGQALQAYLEANLTFIAAHPRDVSAVVEVVGNHRDTDGELVFDAARESTTLTPLMQLFRDGQSAA